MTPLLTPEDLDLVVARTGHGRYRELTDPAHPDFDPAYRPIVAAMAAGFRGEPELPGLGRMAAGLATAVVHVAAAVAQGEPVSVPAEVHAERLSICRRCDHFRPSDERCGMHDGCGCHMPTKAWGAPLSCPIGRWGPWTS